MRWKFEVSASVEMSRQVLGVMKDTEDRDNLSVEYVRDHMARSLNNRWVHLTSVAQVIDPGSATHIFVGLCCSLNWLVGERLNRLDDQVAVAERGPITEVLATGSDNIVDVSHRQRSDINDAEGQSVSCPSVSPQA